MFPCPRQDFHQSQTYFMLPEMLKRISTQGRTDEPEACTSAITTEKVEDIFPFSDDLDCMDQNDLFLL